MDEKLKEEPAIEASEAPAEAGQAVGESSVHPEPDETASAPAAEIAPREEIAPDPPGPPAAVAGEALAPEPPKTDVEKKWYIVHTYSGYEQKVKQSLEKQIDKLRRSKQDRHRRLANYFGEILIPTENVVELVKGQRRQSTRKFFPGYILVQMELNDESWHMVRETPKISGFVGGTKEPTPITEEELTRILRQEKEGAERPKPRIQFERGENVRVVTGPFANFTGVVEDVKPEKAKVKVLVTIFGRATPVELSFIEVEKA
jgi:transcriptional antiterminator NusG